MSCPRHQQQWRSPWAACWRKSCRHRGVHVLWRRCDLVGWTDSVILTDHRLEQSPCEFPERLLAKAVEASAATLHEILATLYSWHSNATLNYAVQDEKPTYFISLLPHLKMSPRQMVLRPTYVQELPLAKSVVTEEVSTNQLIKS